MLCPWIVLQDTCLSLSSNVICMMCTPAYEYTYIWESFREKGPSVYYNKA